MLGIQVSRTESSLFVKWQLARVEILLKDITEVYEDDTYGGEPADAVRIGTPYGTADRVVLKPASKTYLLFTSSGGIPCWNAFNRT